MSFIERAINAIKPPPPAVSGDDKMIGVTDSEALKNRYFGKLAQNMKNKSRYELLIDIEEMIHDGALVDKVLEKLCGDACANPVQIEARTRTRVAIEGMLKRIEWQKYAQQYVYMWLAHGDLFLQKIYEKSSLPGKIGWISEIVRMPTETMLRNVNVQDKFENPNEAYYQVPDIRYGFESDVKIPFHEGKILHARNDHIKSKHVPYGRSIYVSAVRFFNMAMMLLEDSAIGRHQSTQNMYVHYIGRHADLRVTDTMVKDYSKKAKANLTENTTHFFLDGKNELDLIGGTKARIAGVDDIRLVLSILAVALDYPIDLLSAGVADDSGGEELFRKEVVLSRTIMNIIEKVNMMILDPLIKAELWLQNIKPDYRLVTQPITFEDKAKKSKRQSGEVDRRMLSRESYFEENHPERNWSNEKVRIDQDLAFEQELADKYPDAYGVMGRINMEAGETGSEKNPVEQQERLTPGSRGTEEREDLNDG